MNVQKINTSVSQLKKIIAAAERAIQKDKSLCESIQLETTREADARLDCDMVAATVKCKDSHKGDDENVFWNWM